MKTEQVASLITDWWERYLQKYWRTTLPEPDSSSRAFLQLAEHITKASGEHTLPIKASDIGLPDDADGYTRDERMDCDGEPSLTLEDAIDPYGLIRNEVGLGNPVFFDIHAWKKDHNYVLYIVQTVRVRATLKIERVEP